MGFKREGNDLVEGANRLRRIIMVEGGGGGRNLGILAVTYGRGRLQKGINTF